MEAERKKLYRELLHRAMIDVRAHTAATSRFSHLWSGRQPSRARALAFVNDLHDWLHNVALFSALDFEGSHEEWFWRDYATFRKQYPADKWALWLEGIIERLR